MTLRLHSVIIKMYHDLDGEKFGCRPIFKGALSQKSPIFKEIVLKK